ncbi:unnamed protein product [Penicillium camemberti]|uniref:Str. FM013 n=1 Tax=Penicillium camemberti (strain FM 013) TaxID=1429867 RepID=A0A0G4PV01_PENC3|nr:unnamed protein product [Penicillium camemberti]
MLRDGNFVYITYLAQLLACLRFNYQYIHRIYPEKKSGLPDHFFDLFSELL